MFTLAGIRFMHEVLRRNGRALKYLPPELQLERDLVLQAVHLNGRALQHAVPLMKQDRDLVICAPQQVWCVWMVLAVI